MTDKIQQYSAFVMTGLADPKDEWVKTRTPSTITEAEVVWLVEAANAIHLRSETTWRSGVLIHAAIHGPNGTIRYVHPDGESDLCIPERERRNATR